MSVSILASKSPAYDKKRPSFGPNQIRRVKEIVIGAVLDMVCKEGNTTERIVVTSKPFRLRPIDGSNSLRFLYVVPDAPPETKIVLPASLADMSVTPTRLGKFRDEIVWNLSNYLLRTDQPNLTPEQVDILVANIKKASQ